MDDRPTLVTLDVEGVLLPEIWIAVAERTGIDELRRTTRDEPDYDVLMRGRLDLLDRHGLTMSVITETIAGLAPLPGAVEFLDALRARTQVVLLSDTFAEFARPLMAQLGWPTIFCHNLEVVDDRIVGYRLRIADQKRHAVLAFQALGYRVVAGGDSYNDVVDAAGRRRRVPVPRPGQRAGPSSPSSRRSTPTTSWPRPSPRLTLTSRPAGRRAAGGSLRPRRSGSGGVSRGCAVRRCNKVGVSGREGRVDRELVDRRTAIERERRRRGRARRGGRRRIRASWQRCTRPGRRTIATTSRSTGPTRSPSAGRRRRSGGPPRTSSSSSPTPGATPGWWRSSPTPPGRCSGSRRPRAAGPAEGVGLVPGRAVGRDRRRDQRHRDGARHRASRPPCSPREHWYEPVRDWVCYSAPVRAPDGSVAGVIDLSTTWDRANPLGLRTIGALARLMELELASAAGVGGRRRAGSTSTPSARAAARPSTGGRGAEPRASSSWSSRWRSSGRRRSTSCTACCSATAR